MAESNDPLGSSAHVGSPRRTTLKAFSVIMAATFVGTAAGLPYILTLQGDVLAELDVPLAVVVAGGLAQTLVLAAILGGLGLWLGPRLGLGAPLLRRLVEGDRSAWAEWRAALPLALTSGALIGLVILALDGLLFAPVFGEALAESGAAAVEPWQALLASLYGGIVEEVLLRLGVMTLVVWLASKVTRTARPGPRLVWFGIIVSALLFSIGHLPVAATILPLTALWVTRILVLNTLGGLLFGWLYWRRGLLVAMSAHWMADIALHVFGPLLAS